jgi:hypothetical protein
MQSLHPKSTLESLPAGLSYARDQALGGELAKSEPGDPEPANKGAAAAGYLTPIDHSRRTGVTGQLGQPGVILFRLKLCPHGGILLRRRALAFVTINPGGLCHKKRAI